jgi:hypothetical protein
MFYNDARRGKNGADIYRTKTGFRYPLSKDRSGHVSYYNAFGWKPNI